MESIITKSIIASVLAILMILSGLWLRKHGEPYKKWIFTIHKLSVIAIIIFIVLIYIQHLKTFIFQGTGLTLFILSNIFILTAFITGALLSFENISSYRMKIIHRLSSWITQLFIPVIWLVCH